MKYILSILLFFCVAAPAMSQVFIGPEGGLHPVGLFPVASSQEIQGSIISVQSLAERNALPAAFRGLGMLVWVKDSTVHYTLAGGLTNASWVKLPSITSNTSGVNVEVDPLSVHISDTATMLAPYLRFADASNLYQTKLTQQQIDYWNNGGNVVNNYSTTTQTNHYIDSILQAHRLRFNLDQFTVIGDSIVLNELNLVDSSWRNSPLYGTTRQDIEKWNAGVDLTDYAPRTEMAAAIHDSLSKYVSYLDSNYFRGNNTPDDGIKTKLKTINTDSIHGIGNLTITGGGGGTGAGTVTSVAAVSTYGLTAVVTNPTTTPSITMTIDTSKFITITKFSDSLNLVNTKITNIKQQFLDSITNVKNIISSGGGGTVLSVSATAGYGMTVSVTNPTSTPSIAMAIDTSKISTTYNVTKSIRDSLTNIRTLITNTVNTTNDTTINNTTYNTTDTSLTLGNNTTWYIYNPPSIRANLRLTLPPGPKNGQEIKISFGGQLTSGIIVTSLVIQPNTGQSLLQSTVPSTPEAGETISYKYNQPNAKWYRL